jgi:hypothetical protein
MGLAQQLHGMGRDHDGARSGRRVEARLRLSTRPFARHFRTIAGNPAFFYKPEAIAVTR